MISKSVIPFLIDLSINNNRPWFKENEKRYREAKKAFETFTDELIYRLKDLDETIDGVSAKDCIFRIFRDVRFSASKEPYKINFGAYISRGGRKGSYAGYYIHIEPDRSFAGGGIYMPEPGILRSIRQEIYEHTDEYRRIITRPSFSNYFTGIYGDKLKMAPKGFPNDFPDIDLLKYKSYAVTHSLDNSAWADKNIIDSIMDIYRAQYDFNRFLNRAVARVIED